MRIGQNYYEVTAPTSLVDIFRRTAAVYLEVGVKQVCLTMCEGPLGSREEDNTTLIILLSFRCQDVILLESTAVPYMSLQQIKPNYPQPLHVSSSL